MNVGAVGAVMLVASLAAAAWLLIVVGRAVWDVWRDEPW